MKPLTADEIAELRGLLVKATSTVVPDPMGALAALRTLRVGLDDVLPRLLDEVERSRAVLVGIWELARAAEVSGDPARAMEACFEIERRVFAK